MDGLVNDFQDVFVMVASNNPWDLDKAFLRRLDKRVYVQLPKTEDRMRIIKKKFRFQKVDQSLDYEMLGRVTKGFSGSDLDSLCKEVVMESLRKAYGYDIDGLDGMSEEGVRRKMVIC